MLLLKFWLPDLESWCPHMWGCFSEALPYTHNSVKSIYPSAVLSICSTVVDNQPWSPMPTYLSFGLRKLLRKSFQTLPSVAVNMHQLRYPSFRYFLFGLLPPKSTHMGKGGRTQSRYIPTLRAIFLIIIMNLYVLSSQKGMFQCLIFNSPWLEWGLQHNTFLLPDNHILV